MCVRGSVAPHAHEGARAAGLADRSRREFEELRPSSHVECLLELLLLWPAARCPQAERDTRASDSVDLNLASSRTVEHISLVVSDLTGLSIRRGCI